MLFSFLYLAVGALFGLLIRCRRGPDVKDERHAQETVLRVINELRPRLPQHVTVLRQQLRVPLAMLREQPRRPFDVREQEGDCPLRELPHPDA